MVTVTTDRDIKRLAGTYQVNVTLEHLAKGTGNDSDTCPIFLAVSEMFPGFKVKVLRTSVQIFPGRGKLGLYGKLPQIAAEFGYDLDHGTNGQPFSFALRLMV